MVFTALYNSEGKLMSFQEVLAMLPTGIINRVEVIDDNGRSYVNWKEGNKVELHSQDDGRTLKIYVNEKK